MRFSGGEGAGLRQGGSVGAAKARGARRFEGAVEAGGGGQAVEGHGSGWRRARHAACQEPACRRHRDGPPPVGRARSRRKRDGGDLRCRGKRRRGARTRCGGDCSRGGAASGEPPLPRAERPVRRSARSCASADSGRFARFAHARARDARGPRAHGRPFARRGGPRACRCGVRHAPARGARRAGASNPEPGCARAAAAAWRRPWP